MNEELKPKAQELYERVRDGLKAQGGLSWDAECKICLYRSPDGKKCAAGLLMPDDAIVEESEDLYSHCNSSALIAGGVPTALIGMVAEMQRQHDRAAAHGKGLEEALRRLAELARFEGLRP